MATLRSTAAAALLTILIGCAQDRATDPSASSVAAEQSGLTAHREGGDDHRGADILIRDDCDPTDPGWAPTGGCLLRRGDVSLAEFGAENGSPLSTAVIGHQAWRNDPPYLEARQGRSLRIRNAGGRVHTFTEVAVFGGGRVPPLNQGLTRAPECPGVDVAPGGSITLRDLSAGNHRFQCCIHPWMRALVTVEPREADDHREKDDN